MAYLLTTLGKTNGSLPKFKAELLIGFKSKQIYITYLLFVLSLRFIKTTACQNTKLFLHGKEHNFVNKTT